MPTFILLGVSLLVGGVAFSAQRFKPEYAKPVIIKGTGFRAVITEEGVATSWKRYKRKDFRYYKVVRSAENPDPYYPEDGAVFFSEDRNEVEYVDRDVMRAGERGPWFYRLCIISKRHKRWCSPVTAVEIDEASGELDPPDATDFD